MIPSSRNDRRQSSAIKPTAMRGQLPPLPPLPLTSPVPETARNVFPSYESTPLSFLSSPWCTPVDSSTHPPPPPPPFPGFAAPRRYSPSPLTTPSVYYGATSPTPRASSPSFDSFVPISGGGSGRSLTPVSPCFVPNKPYAASPSMMSYDTAETASMTVTPMVTPVTKNLWIREVNPALSALSPPPLYRGSPVETDRYRETKSPRPSTPTLSRRSPRPGTPTNSSRKSPRPGTPNSITAEDGSDLVRKTRIKTEMCMHYSQGRPCPFGQTCTYAHGEEELQMTKLLDLQSAGLADAETYRTRPCFTWVATGCCPFGKRCVNIHDPRAASGTSQSWLTHTETQGNNMETDINVDALHQKYQHSIYHGTPFGESFSLSSGEQWSDLYQKLCQISYKVKEDPGWLEASGSRKERREKRRRRGKVRGATSQPSSTPIHPIHKLQIALIMRGDAEWCYKYRPQHVVYEEMCMILQKRAFVLSGTGNMNLAEIDIDAYNPKALDQILVHELAFGPDDDPSVRKVALWFNVDEKQVVECTPGQAKRFRFKRGLNKKDGQSHDSQNGNQNPSAFDHLENFTMIRPHDADAFALATDMMEHRLAVLRNERVPQMQQRHEMTQHLEERKKALQERFTQIRSHWTAWAWPVNIGRERVTKNTPVPNVEGKYEIKSSKKCKSSMRSKKSSTVIYDDISDEDDTDEAASREIGMAAKRVWNSFMVNAPEISKSLTTAPSEARTWYGGSVGFVPLGQFGSMDDEPSRLPVFEELAQGHELSLDRWLPHINDTYDKQGVDKTNKTIVDPPPSTTDIPSQRCWEDLLLKTDKMHPRNEWQTVREHFESSKSKRVLDIIQQT